ncbi:histidinol-phosphate transaminase [Candidatus Bathyarchaeota archaeon]|nr:MAG: histidinol-phosphate transaminase [Candidatus Bathyarchaeota archaeon]
MRIRTLIKNFQPYEWEFSIIELAKKYGFPPDKILRFDTNTMPYPPIKLLEELKQALPNLQINEYPETTYKELREALANYLGRNIDEITVTAGCDEALDIIAKVFVDSETNVLVSTPTYAMYRVTVEAMGGKIVQILRKPDFSDNTEKLVEAVNENTRLIFLCSPNNPTGNLTSEETVVKLLEETDCAVVVDESYAEFCSQTFINLIDKYENLIILRTFSKAFSMAGARVGYIVSNKKTINLLNLMRPPNSLTVISLFLAKKALENLDWMRENIKKIVEEREKLIKILNKIDGVKVYPSYTNFILTKFLRKNVNEIHQKLLENGIITRNVSSQPLLENCLRITVRKPEENNVLVDTLKKILEG